MCWPADNDKEKRIELWDLYDEHRRLTGRDHVRGEEIPKGFYHLVIHVWLRNKRGEYLISQRSADRREFPLLWETVGGSVLKGEDSVHGALREAKKEVGLTLDSTQGRLLFSEVGRVFRGVKFSDILDVWCFDYDGPVDLKNATTKEVSQTAWMTAEQIRRLYDAGQLVPTLEYFFEKVEGATP